jgi:uncharacterized phage-associated protein
MVTANDVAKYFLTLVDSEDDPITPLKLQKLLYYAQGMSLAVFDELLFADPLEAWSHGPVAPAVYREFKDFVADPIPRLVEPEELDFDEQTEELLVEVYALYGQFTAATLRNMTHNEAPWRETPEGKEISQAKIKAYFKNIHQFNYHNYSVDGERKELVMRRGDNGRTFAEVILAREIFPANSDALEDQLLVESGALSRLLQQSRQTSPVPDWEQALNGL